MVAISSPLIIYMYAFHKSGEFEPDDEWPPRTSRATSHLLAADAARKRHTYRLWSLQRRVWVFSGLTYLGRLVCIEGRATPKCPQSRMSMKILSDVCMSSKLGDAPSPARSWKRMIIHDITCGPDPSLSNLLPRSTASLPVTSV